jgi:branched-chain amino acid transport system permease protein
MATIGLAYVLEGVGDLMWGANVKMLDVGLPKGPSEFILDTTDMFIDKLEISAAVVAIILVVLLTLFSAYTKMGRALRAVADDHQAALSVGISLETIWWIVWSVSGIVALVAGVMWGAKSGVQFSLSLIALKALPVLMLGGFTSIPGAIIGGLMIGLLVLMIAVTMLVGLGRGVMINFLRRATGMIKLVGSWMMIMAGIGLTLYLTNQQAVALIFG